MNGQAAVAGGVAHADRMVPQAGITAVHRAAHRSGRRCRGRRRVLDGQEDDAHYSTLAAGMNIGQSKLSFDGIQLDSPALGVTGRGFIGFDQAINFELAAHTAGGIGQVANRVGMGSQAGGGGIPLMVTGTVESPRVRPSVGKMVTNVAGELLDSLFKKKSE